MADTKPLRILRLREVLARTGLSRTTLYELIGKRLFPHPVSLSVRAVGWIEAEVETWIAARTTMDRIK